MWAAAADAATREIPSPPWTQIIICVALMAIGFALIVIND